MQQASRDILVLGAGGAGLTAAYRLGTAGHAVTIIEQDSRPGGRTKSGWHAGRPYNSGTQFLLGDAGPVADLRNELSLPVRELDMAPVAAFIKGRYRVARKDWLLALKLPLSLRAKVSLALHMRRFMRKGELLFKPGWAAANKARIMQWDKMPYSDLLRGVHPDAIPFFEALAGDFCGSSPRHVSALSGLISTVAVSPAFGRRLVGMEGNEALHQRLLDGSGAKLLSDCEVVRVRTQADDVVVTVRRKGGEEDIRGCYAVCALPADVVTRVVDGLPDAKRRALAKVVYRPFLSATFLTEETGRAPWQDFSVMSVFDKSFNFVVNQTRPFGKDPGSTAAGSAIFAMIVTDQAQRLLDLSTDEIRAIVRRDMLDIFPEMEAVLKDVVIEKWRYGIPGLKPGALAEVEARKAPHGRIFFAGDYVTDTTANLRSAVASAEEASALILSHLQSKMLAQ